MNSKRKGNAGELELLHQLEARGITARRNDQKWTGGLDNPDIAADVRGLPLHIEVKRTERLRLREALRQAERDAAGRVPVVAFRGNREPWRVVLRLEDFLKLTVEDDKGGEV